MKAIIYLIPVFLFSFCKKEPITTTIDGTVINIGTKEPIEGVKVTVVDGISSGDSFFGSSTSGTGKTVVKYTGADGKFSITLEGESPFLYLEKTGYRFVIMDYGAGQSVKEFLPGKHYTNEVLALWADAYFNPFLKGKNSLTYDSIFIDVIYKNIKVGSTHLFIGNDPHQYYEGSKGYKTIGDTYTSYWLKYQIKGQWYEHVDSVYIMSFTTYTDTIYY